ncbi:ubiquitin carboxyl-terminal hydrolase isozyme L3-like [Parasteatoda tepidariorum]|uniref:ubiquitin carboxyl-terminal hydrolase isozyme L3-like n=1 Tax=Parasteatoda tepidariorum TaxID=114398 RepID=UPI00077FCF79|nr:ubiquitin carboxyl-terminal hydrolase isozyme L3-like [Parasteatoda tepidariorum]
MSIPKPQSRISLFDDTKVWLPLESNVNVFNRYLRHLGVGSRWTMADITSLEFDMLREIPTPAVAVLFLQPLTKNYEKYQVEMEEKADKQTREIDPDLYFMAQSIKNAAGTVALIHAVANNMEEINFEEVSMVREFITKSKGSNFLEKAQMLEQCAELREAHEQRANEGQTTIPDMDVDVPHHFVTFVNMKSRLYELDGLKTAPVKHGNTNKDSFLRDVAEVCKGHMKRDPNNMDFAAMAFHALEK